ncbi:hypothetical protein GCM10027284_33530 [Cyclobacterium sediminis]
MLPKMNKRNYLLPLILISLLVNGLKAQNPLPNWEKVSEKVDWQARDSQGELVYNNKLWILGGWFDSHHAPPRDVWSSANGKDWNKVASNAPWIHSDLPMTFVFKDKMWITGGWYNGRLEGHSASNSIWSSTNGADWKLEKKAASWTPRIASTVVEFKGKLWLMGGIENYYFGDEKSLKNDVWVSENGKDWELATVDAGWSPRAYHQSAVLNGKMYVFGGGNYTPEYHAKNDVWVTEDGINWEQVTEAAPWHERIWFSSVVYRDCIWVMGGWSNNPYKNWGDAWYSRDGINWTEYKPGIFWPGRHEHSAFVFQDKIFVAGGMLPPLVNDVWSLDLPEDW